MATPRDKTPGSKRGKRKDHKAAAKKAALNIAKPVGGTLPAAPAAPQVPTAAAPAAQAPAPPIAPFLTAEDLEAIGNFDYDFATKLGQLDSNLANVAADTKLAKKRVDESAKEGTAATAEAMSARGLFQSSIKDAAIFDLEAQRAIQQQALDDRVTRLTLDTDTQKKALLDWKTSFMNSRNNKAVENAQTITPVVPEPATPAAAAAPKPTAPTTPAAVKPVPDARAAAAAFAHRQREKSKAALATARARTKAPRAGARLGSAPKPSTAAAPRY